MKWPWDQHISWLHKQIEDERTAHVAERERILAENKRLQDECERLRLALGQPSRMAETPEVIKPPDPDALPVFTGTPWERVRAREVWMQSPAGKVWAERQLAKLKIEESGELKEKEH